MSAKYKPLPPERRDRKVSGWNLEKDRVSLSQRGCLGAKEDVTSSAGEAGRREEGIPRKQEQRGVRQDCLAQNQVVWPEPGCSPQRGRLIGREKRGHIQDHQGLGPNPMHSDWPSESLSNARGEGWPGGRPGLGLMLWY